LKQWKHNLAAMVVLAVVYFVAGKLGLSLAFVNPSSTAVWAPTGIALAAFLLLGYRVWPAIALGAFLVNLTTAGSPATSLVIAAGNTLEGLLGAYLVNRFARGARVFERARDIFKFALLAAMLSTALSATVGVTALCLGGFARWTSFGSIWLTWWLGDAVGDLVVAPLIVLYSSRARARWNASRWWELAILVGGLALVAQVVFGGLFLHGPRDYPLEYLCFPFLVWVAFRFSQRETAAVTLLLSAIALGGTLRGFGPFVRGNVNESLLLLQAFMGLVAVMTLGLAAVVAERQAAMRRAQELAVTDPLTGLANYRKLLIVLEAEIKRSARTGRPFALLLLDLDRLKQVNDDYGHLVGSRALCRLAEALRQSCRDVDTPARYGGDEFAVVLPEAGEETAQQVAERIRERLAGDPEPPPISVSLGAALCPRDGDTADHLLAAADHGLYHMKRQLR
jgi:diguanylate cyclase (GGDEF)-like protein